MNGLKAENMGKCFSLLREFIDEAKALSNKKGIAVLALNHLQKITAGTVPGESPDGGGTVPASPVCVEIPRLDGGPSTGNG